MFDIGFFEILLVGVVALLVVGPERLPDAVRTTARWWGNIKRTLNNARDELEREIGADDIRRDLHNERVMRELEESRREMEQTARELDSQVKHEAAQVRADTEITGSSETAESGESDESAGQPAPASSEDYLPEEDEDLQDPEYPEHWHDHGDPDMNPHHPDHYKDEEEAGEESAGEKAGPEDSDSQRKGSQDKEPPGKDKQS